MINIFVARNIWKTAFLPILDYFNLIFAAGVVYVLRYNVLNDTFTGTKSIYGQEYLQLSISFSILIVSIFALLGVYSITQKPRFFQNILNIIIGVVVVMLLSSSYLYFTQFNRQGVLNQFELSRFIVASFGFFAILFVFVGRVLFKIVENILYKFKIGVYDVALIGKSDDNDEVVEYLQSINYIEKIHYFEDVTAEILEQDIKPLFDYGKCGEIYLNCKTENAELEKELSDLAERQKIRFLFSPNGYDNFDLYKVSPVKINSQYYFEMYHTAISGWSVVLKRIFDLTFSLIFILVFSWLYLLIAILIKVDSKGSILYFSQRVGPNGRVFNMVKFRRFKAEFCTNETDPDKQTALEYEQELIKSQGVNADRGALYKIKSDPRMTKIGAFLEKTSLDELPQFFNVIIGNLSLVGPRAHQPREVKKYMPHHHKVLNIKPGITGLAQIKGRSDLHFEDEVKIDTFYVQNWSFYMDIIILLKTPLVIISPRHKS